MFAGISYNNLINCAEGVAQLNELLQNLIADGLPVYMSIHITDLLDIAILSFVIYKLLWMVRKSSSGRVLRGV